MASTCLAAVPLPTGKTASISLGGIFRQGPDLFLACAMRAMLLYFLFDQQCLAAGVRGRVIGCTPKAPPPPRPLEFNFRPPLVVACVSSVGGPNKADSLCGVLRTS